MVLKLKQKLGTKSIKYDIKFVIRVYKTVRYGARKLL